MAYGFSAPQTRSNTAAWIVGGGLALLVGVAVVLFSYGEDLFGSDPGTIDEYNTEMLESCDVPADAVLVRRFIEPITDLDGQEFRSMTDVYAADAAPDQIGAALGVDVGYELTMPAEHACRFGNRPGVWVTALDDAPDEFWGGDGAENVIERPVPADARALFRLRLAQAVEDGVFD